MGGLQDFSLSGNLSGELTKFPGIIFMTKNLYHSRPSNNPLLSKLTTIITINQPTKLYSLSYSTIINIPYKSGFMK